MPKGSDINCAAVSTIIQSLYIGITKVLKINSELLLDEAYLNCKILDNYSGEDNLKEKVLLLTETAINSLLSLPNNKEYLDIKIENN